MDFRPGFVFFDGLFEVRGIDQNLDHFNGRFKLVFAFYRLAFDQAGDAAGNLAEAIAEKLHQAVQVLRDVANFIAGARQYPAFEITFLG
jgi:hypothetical protein